MENRRFEPAGRCACGACTFETRGPADWVGICHCGSCRRATGGALVAAAGFARVNVRLSGESLTGFASSAGVVRTFCARCGSSLGYESDSWPDDFHLMVGVFDAPATMTPRFHIFWDHKLPWMAIEDGLTRYRRTPGAGTLAD